jgi:hypothetical protein
MMPITADSDSADVAAPVTPLSAASKLGNTGRLSACWGDQHRVCFTVESFEKAAMSARYVAIAQRGAVGDGVARSDTRR